ncbi:MAG: DUF2294 family protein [Planctomycetaceae bacterium]|nr:DUF2294 family protein [Planctomycetaceae bacterium]
MVEAHSEMAKQAAQAATHFEQQRTGRKPTSVNAVLVNDSLVITLGGGLSPAEKELAKSPVGAAQVRELHRQLFLTSCGSLRQEMGVITGVAVWDATSELATHSGTVVLVFLLAAKVAASTWSGSMSEPTALLPSEIWAAKRLAELARQFEKHRTGRTPASVTAVLVDDSLVITLRGELSTAEQELAKTPEGAAQVRESHRQLFLTTSGSLRQEIEVITGVAVLEATSEVATHTGTVVLVFLLAASVAASTWSESTSEPASPDQSSVNGEPALGGEG